MDLTVGVPPPVGQDDGEAPLVGAILDGTHELREEGVLDVGDDELGTRLVEVLAEVVADVAEALVVEGEGVEQGQVLLRLDDRDARLRAG